MAQSSARPDSPASRSARRSRWTRRRIARALAAFVFGLFLAFGAYACVARRALEREIENTPRDPVTGIVLGTEALSLDPPADDAPTSACLLLHGWAGSRRDFADLGERLAAAGFHVRMTRLPGHGTTPRDFAKQTPDSLYEGAAREFHALRNRFKEVNVIGMSMGGTHATLLAANEDVDHLVLVAPYYGVTYRWFYILPPETWNALIGWAVPYLIKPKGMVRVNRPGAAREIYSYRVIPMKSVRTLILLGKEARQTEVLQAIRCPVLIVMAKGDEAASPERVQEAFDQMTVRNKTLHWFPERSNHHLLHDYDREEAKQVIVDFLTSKSDDGNP